MKNKLLEINPVYEGKFLKFYNFLLEDGRNYEVVSRREVNMENVNDFIADAVDMMIISEDYNYILLVKEWRTPINDYIYAFPAGLREAGEDVVETAKRELFEETGLTLTKIFKILPPAYQSAGMSNEAVSTIVGQATGELSIEHMSSHEDITPIWVSINEIREMLKTEKFSAKCQIALYSLLVEQL